MNATIEKFGWPDTLIAEYAHWVVLLRPSAPTLGSLVLAAKGEATRYGDLPAAAFAEQARVVADIESALAKTVAPERINYLMLMMVDPHVHFHVIPRYGDARIREQQSYPDKGWPSLPDLGSVIFLDRRIIEDQSEWLKSQWTK